MHKLYGKDNRFYDKVKEATQYEAEIEWISSALETKHDVICYLKWKHQIIWWDVVHWWS